MADIGYSGKPTIQSKGRQKKSVVLETKKWCGRKRSAGPYKGGARQCGMGAATRLGVSGPSGGEIWRSVKQNQNVCEGSR